MEHLQPDEIFEASQGHSLRPKAARHAQACVRCRSEIEDLKSLKAAMQALPSAALPPGLLEATRARLSPTPPAAEQAWLFSRWAPISALACLALGLILMLSPDPALVSPSRGLDPAPEMSAPSQRLAAASTKPTPGPSFAGAEARTGPDLSLFPRLPGADRAPGPEPQQTRAPQARPEVPGIRADRTPTLAAKHEAPAAASSLPYAAPAPAQASAGPKFAAAALTAQSGPTPAPGPGLGLRLKGSLMQTGSQGVGLSVDLPGDCQPELKVFSPEGECVWQAPIPSGSRGPWETRWDGRTDRGRQVGSGVYTVLLRCGAQQLTRKVVVAR